MITYLPLEDVRATLGVKPADLLKVEPGLNSLSADFILEDEDDRALRVTFERQTVVRILDDMPLSTEDGEESQGIFRHHFAYEVRGHPFLAIQSEVWKQVCGPITHYQFITGGLCMDVLSAGHPDFSVVAQDKDALARRREREPNTYD